MALLQRLTVQSLIFLSCCLSGCVRQQDLPEPKIQDPYESWNRKVFAFNTGFDQYVFRPLNKVYTAIPPAFRLGVKNFFANLSEIAVVVNACAQGEYQDARHGALRVLVNSSFGCAGLFDLGVGLGYQRKNYDFGQTLYKQGYDETSFLVLPFIGPSTWRDAWGFGVDRLMNPLLYIDNVSLRNEMMSTDFFNLKSEVTAKIDGMPQPPYIKDSYVFYRDSYIQNRKYILNPSKNWDDFYDEPQEEEASPSSPPQ